MNEISTNYNVPAEQVRGQSIAGPESAPRQPETSEPAQAEQNTQANDQKGTRVDTSA
jgi:hypothetical protein